MIRELHRRAVWQAFVVGSLCMAFGAAGWAAIFFMRVEDLWTLFAGPAVFFTLIVLWGAGIVGWGSLLLVRPRCHSVLRRLAAYGPPEEIAASIDQELDEPETLRIGELIRWYVPTQAKYPPVYVTRSWVVQEAAAGLCLVRLDDVVWMRQTVVSIPTIVNVDNDPGDHHYVEIWDRQDRNVRFELIEEDAWRLLILLLDRLPWALSGFDARQDRQWQGRGCKGVEQKREDARVCLLVELGTHRWTWEKKGDAPIKGWFFMLLYDIFDPQHHPNFPHLRQWARIEMMFEDLPRTFIGQ